MLTALWALAVLGSLALAGCSPVVAPPSSGQAAEDAAGQPAPALPSGQAAPKVIIGQIDSRLNVRSGPGADFDVVAKLLPGDEVALVGASADGQWLQIELDGVDGPAWISAEFAALSGDLTQMVAAAGQALPTPTAAAEPEDLAPTPTPPAEETQAPLLPTPTPAADAEPTALPSPQPTPTVATAIIQPQRMNVRGGPSTEYPVVTTLGAGTPLAILGLAPGGDWYQVAVDDVDQPAWVFRGLVEVMGPVEAIQPVPEDQIPAAPTPEPAAAAPSAAPSAAVAAPPPSAPGFFGYGVQGHFISGGADSGINATADMGFNWIKQQVEWKRFQPQAGPAAFGELHGIANAAASRGINVLFSVVKAPAWAREPGFDGGVEGPPADPQTYASFVGQMAGEFCGSNMKAIEVWNEQNLHYEWGNKPLDPAEYMNLLRPAYAAIKAACPSMLVISGALTPAGSNPPFAMDDFQYLEGMYQNGLANYADGIGAHPSGFNVPPSVTWENACGVIQTTGNSFNGACDTPHHSWAFRSTMEGYRNIMVVYGDAEKRVWPTEFGWAAGGAFDPRYAYANDNSYDEQAAWTAEAYTLMRDWGWVGPAFLWNLNFRVVADGTEMAQWGIVRNDYSPLPVYDALKNMPK